MGVIRGVQDGFNHVPILTDIDVPIEPIANIQSYAAFGFTDDFSNK